MGIDYGAKKIGIALSDTGGIIAFPHSIITNDTHAVSAITDLCMREGVTDIVAGDTRTASGATNKISDALHEFVSKVEHTTGITVMLVSEAGTSGAARVYAKEGAPRGKIQSPRAAQSDFMHDARAAALILQRFLDTQPRS